MNKTVIYIYNRILLKIPVLSVLCLICLVGTQTKPRCIHGVGYGYTVGDTALLAVNVCATFGKALFVKGLGKALL